MKIKKGAAMQKCTMFGLLVALLVLLVPVKIPAEEAGHGSKEKGLENRHGIELFIGNTHDDGEDGFTVGLGYEYRLNQLLGIGGMVEYAGGNLKDWFLAVPFLLHPYKGWRFYVAPGVAIHNSNVDEFLFRVGASYEFEIGKKWAITPGINVNFVDNSSEALIFGLSFGYKF
jgi:opacity protein-like surface antigen